MNDTKTHTNDTSSGAASELSAMLCHLRSIGCYPSVAYRGNGIWRAHVNGTGNFWDEAETPDDALRSAMFLWRKAGCPMDGYAA